MSATKRSTDVPLPQLASFRDTSVDREDVTMLFAPPRELLKRATSSADEEDDEEDIETRLQRHPAWKGDDEMTLLAPISATVLSPKARVTPPPIAPIPKLHESGLREVAPRAPRISVDISVAEMNAILRPRRSALWLALAIIALVGAILFAIARLVP